MPPTHLSVSAKPLSGRHLSFEEREEIALLRVRDRGVREIARRLGRAPSTISCELRRRRGDPPRRPRVPRHDRAVARRSLRASAPGVEADEQRGAAPHRGGSSRGPDRAGGRRRAARPAGRLDEAPVGPAPAPAVGASLEPRAALGQARNRLPRGRGDAHLPRGDPSLPPRPGARRGSRRELIACPAWGRALRVPRARTHGRRESFVSPEVMISARPAEAADRAVPGPPWDRREGDLILGLRSSAIGTLVKRTTRRACCSICRACPATGRRRASRTARRLRAAAPRRCATRSSVRSRRCPRS